MNCGNYQNLISAYLDGELDSGTWRAVETHLEECDECTRVFSDFSTILEFCDEAYSAETAPPNSHALWCRINNIIEAELPETQAETVTTGSRASSGFWNTGLNLSAGQVASAVAGIALVSSLLTIVAFQNLTTPADPLAGQDGEETVVEKVLADLGLGDSKVERNERRINEQRAAIEYWRNRVEVRRASWNSETRVVFDRNLSEIDKAVSEYTRLLNENPHDTISNEMLDSALKEKMELLREFSEL
ncbi:MAG: zf-HC2 domain-containing protein [Aridibacter famidurans]|nr:zf-HC2 domain-containing protein [Aridibacter famidurans]